MDVSVKSNFEEAVVFTAIHNGHAVRDELKHNFVLCEEDQLREEDPYTGLFADLAENSIIVNTSRFEVDLNRTRERCFYQKPADAWGLNIHKQYPSVEMVKTSQTKYDEFYYQTKILFDKLAEKHKMFFVLDIHSYNHKRNGENALPDDPEKNPEIILGTNNMNNEYLPLVNAIRDKIIQFDYFGRKLDARINVKFTGGAFSRWIHDTYPGKAICIALEFKKIFMNEWTAEVDYRKLNKLKELLRFILSEIKKLLVEGHNE